MRKRRRARVRNQKPIEVKPAQWTWSYGYWNDRECFPVVGPGIMEDDSRLFRFASPQLADQMCRVLQSAWRHGYEAAKEEIRLSIGLRDSARGGSA